MQSASASATGLGLGKLILCGEHAVVYGHPAVAVAVDRCTTVRLTQHDGPTDIAYPTVDDPRLMQAVLTVLPVRGWHVHIDSDLPIGRGMGSSAALAVGLVRAAAATAGAVLSLDEVWERAFAVERVFHGNPSGLDQAISSRGGALLFRRGPPPMFTPLPVAHLPLVVLDSGTAGNTAELVAGVASRRPEIDSVLDDIGELVNECVGCLDKPADLGPLLTINHGHLRRIGVSTPALDGLVELALGAGALGAKLSGAGGGGVVLALAPDHQAVLEAAQAAGVVAFSTHVTEAA